jgi:hypothetical protein
MAHPFLRVPAEHRRAIGWALFGATLAVAVALTAIDQALPVGILTFELCAYGDRCDPMIASYAQTRFEVGASLGLDYLFMPLYAALFSWGLVFASEARGEVVRRIAAWLARGSVLAAMLDAIENAALYAMMAAEGATPLTAWTASGCASVKLALLLIAGLAIAVIRLLPRRS